MLAIGLSMGVGMGAYGLAWAQSIMAAIEVAILFAVMGARFRGLLGASFWSGVWRMISGAGFTAPVSYVMILLLPLPAGDDSSIYLTLPKFAIVAASSLVAYILFSRMLKLHEAQPYINFAKRLTSGGVRG